MVAFQLLPVVLSLLVLGAHFLRAGRPLLLLVVLLVLALLFVRRRWAARVVQVTLSLGALAWIRALVVLASLRLHTGEPVRRLVLILGTVAVVSLLSAWLMQVGALRRVYRLDRDDAVPAEPPLIPPSE
jgi:hypothetical protein